MEIVLIVLVLLLLVGGGVFVFIRLRNQQQSFDDLPLPEIGDPVDYTAEPPEEEVEETPKTLQDRLREAPLPIKILLALVPVLAVLFCAVLFFVGASIASGPAGPTPQPPSITIDRATVSSPNTITVVADTTLLPETEVRAELLQNDEPFPWFQPDSAVGRVDANGDLELRLQKDPEAPSAEPDATLEIVLSTDVSGRDGPLQERIELSVPDQFAEAIREQATPTPEPTTAPTSEPEAAPTSEPEPEPESTPAPAPTQLPGLDVIVGNGGNVRAEPTAESAIVGGVVLNDQVTVLERNAEGTWFRITTPSGLTGWAANAVLLLSADQIAQIPIEGTSGSNTDAGGNVPAPDPATATGLTAPVAGFGGNLRASPSFSGEVIGLINEGETVELMSKTEDGIWYQITNARSEEGWSHFTLLELTPEIEGQVPVIDAY